MDNKFKKSSEDLSFGEAIELLQFIEDGKITFSDLKNITTGGVVHMLRGLEWIKTRKDEDQVTVTGNGSKFVLEHNAMIVLRDIKNKLVTHHATDAVINYLEKEGYIYYLKSKSEGYVDVTEKGIKAMSQYFNEE